MDVRICLQPPTSSVRFLQPSSTLCGCPLWMTLIDTISRTCRTMETLNCKLKVRVNQLHGLWNFEILKFNNSTCESNNIFWVLRSNSDRFKLFILASCSYRIFEFQDFQFHSILVTNYFNNRIEVQWYTAVFLRSTNSKCHVAW